MCEWRRFWSVVVVGRGNSRLENNALPAVRLLTAMSTVLTDAVAFASLLLRSYFAPVLLSSGRPRRGTDLPTRSFYVNLGAGARRVYPKGWVQRFPDARWLHVYQNNGDSAWAYGAKSNGGVLVTRPLDGGETLAWSLSGSSPLAAVDHFLWYRCATTDGSCQDGSDAYDAAVAAAPAVAAACAGGGVVGATPVPAPTPTPASAPTPTPTPVPVVIDATPTPAPTPAAPPATGSACAVYAGALGVVRMPAAATGGGDGWEVQTVAGRNALIFRPDKEATSIDAPGAAGVRTFSFAPDEAGSYRVVLRMNAPHPTDYNDVWMKLGAGAKKFQGSTVSSLTAGYFKVYQNKGQREVRATQCPWMSWAWTARQGASSCDIRLHGSPDAPRSPFRFLADPLTADRRLSILLCPLFWL